MRIAIFGSAFNPPTQSHAAILAWASEHYDEVKVVPSFRHAHGKIMLPYGQRLALLQALLDDVGQSNVSIWGIEPTIAAEHPEDRPVYTHDVLSKAQSLWGSAAEILFVVGQDNADTIATFYRASDIMSQWKVETAPAVGPHRSTLIRQAIAQGESFEHMTTPRVAQLLRVMQLYRQADFERPICTVDAVLLKLVQNQLCVGLIRRPDNARVYPGVLALPGGFVHTEHDQSIDDTLYRNLKNKVGLTPAYITKMDFSGSSSRDPHGWSITCPYLCLIASGGDNESDGLQWFPLRELLSVTPKVELPFDHLALIASSVQRFRQRARYSTEPNALLASPFTLPALQRLYEVILESPLHKKNFRDRILESGAIADTGKKVPVGKTTAQLYEHQAGVRYFNRVLLGHSQG
jgi:ADP-ribose pyrophosphatase YjhB (NUDIX family)